MGYSNGSIYAPVSIRDVQRALNTQETDLGRLCRHANINKWARYKPVQYAGFPIRFQSGDSTFEAKTGLNVGEIIDTPSSVAAYLDIRIGYERPVGGINSPYRLTDFVRYNRYALPPCEIVWRTTFKEDTGFGCVVSIPDRSTSEYAEYISFSDLMNEISGYSGFKNADKRLCLAVYDETASDTDPIFYFFSDKFSTVGSSGAWSVVCNMGNSDFVGLLTVGKTYKFQVMVVSNHPHLETIPQGDRYVWELGCSPSQMAYMEGTQTPIQALCLALEYDIDRTRAVYQRASVITDLKYYLDWLSVEKWGNLVNRYPYQVLCTRLYLPAIIVRSPNILSGSAQYQMRVSFPGSSSFEIFRPADRSGNDYYEIEQAPSPTLAETVLTEWLSVADIGGYTTETDPQGNTVYVYEFDIGNRAYTILSRTAEQTANENSGLFLFWDQYGDSFTLAFSLYYKAFASDNARLVRNINVTYNVADGQGVVTDLEF